MNLLHLRAFHTVATEGSYVRASRKLRVTQPTLSAQVHALEEVHGARLFEPRGRGVAPTDTALALLEVTRRLFALELEAEELLRGATALTRGRLVVGADAPYHVVPLVADFHARWPDIDIAIALGNSAEVRRALLARDTDVAVLPELASDDEPDLLVRPLVRDEVVLLVPVAHALAKKKRLRPSDLAGVDMVLREPGSTTRAIFERALAGVALGRTLAIGSREGVREAAAAGLGVGVVFAREHVPDPRLVLRTLDDERLGATESVACLASRRRLPTIAAFWSVVDAHAGARTRTRARKKAQTARG